MNSLDQIPWKDLTHAYGSAADVPELLRALRTASPESDGEESPLWQLFGNIWHQGTVYEATAYAVPFLIELAVDRQTPDRVGILSLLAEIAEGNSYRDVHDNLLKERDFQQKRNQELLWAQPRPRVGVYSVHTRSQRRVSIDSVARGCGSSTHTRTPASALRRATESSPVAIAGERRTRMGCCMAIEWIQHCRASCHRGAQHAGRDIGANLENVGRRLT